jgi:hypothetical protein
MADQIQSYKLVCSGGLNSNENHLELSDKFSGSATRLVNYEPSLYGGYRRLEGYELLGGIDSTVGGSNGEGKVLGVFVYQNEQYGNPYIIAARKDAGANTYSYYKFLDNVGWQVFATGLTLSHTVSSRSVEKVRGIGFSLDSVNYMAFADGVNNGILFDGLNWTFVSPSNTGQSFAQAGGAQVVAAPSLVDFFNNSLWFAGDSAFPTKISVSAKGGGGNILDFATTSPSQKNLAQQFEAPFKVVQIKPFRNDLFIFGANAIQKAFQGEFLYDTEDVTKNVGCIARDSVVEIGGDLLFLAPDGFRPVAGTSRIGDVELESVSKPIQVLLKTLIERQTSDNISSCVVRSKSQVRFFVGDSTIDVQNSFGIIGGLYDKDGSIKWSYGELLGIRASCSTSEYINTIEHVLHGDFDGKVYRQERGTSFNGSNILSVYETPFLDFGDTEQRKVIRKLNTFVRAEGPVELFLTLSYDWGDNATLTPSTYSQESEGGQVKYAGLNIDYGAANVLYGGNSKPIMTTDVQGSGFAVSATFVTIGQSEPFSIQGLVYEFSTAGRR